MFSVGRVSRGTLDQKGVERLTQALGSGTLEKVVNGSANDDATAGLVDLEATNLDTVLAADVLDGGSLANDLDELLTGIAVLVELTDVTGSHALVKGDGDGLVNTAEPDSDVGHEGNLGTELGADLTLVDVASQAVGDDVVGEVLNIVLGRRLGASTRVARDTEDVGHATEVGNQGRDTELGGSSVAAGVGDLSSLGDVAALDKLGETVGPLVVKAVIGREIDNDALVAGGLATLPDGLNEGLADTVGQSHDPAVNLATLLHVTDILRAEVLVDNLLLVVALKLLASELTRGDVVELHVGVRVDKADQLLAGVTTSTDEGNAGRTVHGGVLLADRGVGVGLGKVAPAVGDAELGKGRAASKSGVAANLLASGLAGSLAKTGLEVGVTKHGAAVLGEVLHELDDLVAVLNAIPEHDITLASDAAVGLVEEPAKVLIVLLDGPDEGGMLLLEGSEDVVSNVGQPARLGDSKSGKGGLATLASGKDNGKSVHGAVEVGLEGVLLEEVEVLLNSLLGIGGLAIADEDVLENIKVLELGKAGDRLELAATADEGTGTGVREKLLLELLGVDDGNGGGAGKSVEELLDLLDLEAGTILDPGLGHEVLVLLVEVDGGDLLATSIEETTLLGEVDNLEGLKGTGKLSSGNISVDVKNLAIVGLSHGGEDGEIAVADGSLDSLLVNAGDLADKTPLLLVQVIGAEHASGEGLGVDTHLLELVDELEVLLEEEIAGNTESLGIGNTDTLLELGLNTGILEEPVELGTSAMDNDRIEADSVEELEGGAKLVEVVGQDGAADLDDGETLGGDRGEEGEVLLDLALGTDRGQGLDNHAPGGKIGRASGRGRDLTASGDSAGEGTSTLGNPANNAAGSGPEGNSTSGVHVEVFVCFRSAR